MANKKPVKKITQFKLEFNMKNVFIIGFILLFGYIAIRSISSEINQTVPEKSINVVVEDIRGQKVKKAEIIDNKILIYYKDGTYAMTYKEPNDSFMKILRDSNVNTSKTQIVIKDTQGSSGIMNLLGNLIPTVLMVAFFIFLFRQARGAQDNVFAFGQSKAKKFNKDLPKTTFKDVAGVNEAKIELEEIVDFLKKPEKYKKLGARTPKGVLLVGPAGCGKTLLARAVAGEASVPFFSIAGSEFMEMLVGIGAARVRDLFATAKKSAPSIIFIDEVDAIGRSRSVGMMPSHDEREQTLNQILVEMDGFNPNEQVIVMAATNRGDLLDSALLRPGRFDRRIVVDYPDVEGRKEILKIHAIGKPFAADVNWDRVAKRTVGFSGADLENMLNEAAITAARNVQTEISFDVIEDAAMKVKMGPTKKRMQTEGDKNLTAYHEAGHAILTHFQTETDPVHRISIVSRGMALGYTLIPPQKDKIHETKKHLLQRLAVMMGGRAAEEVVFDEMTTGASNDFEQATNIARAMVIDFGMSDLGPVSYGNDEKSYYGQSQISQEMMAKIDVEIRKILELAYKQAVVMLKEKRELLDKVASELMVKESLDQDEFEAIVGAKTQKA
ncbi:MAG: ATP-dependent zinc metalloprotease FtsH [Candidatus Roizmanbacteria bacterium]|nr:ATP-dependent zinc metalloprotease FtsH [Candidatus Roizmanbacteria bacterium]